MSSYSGIAPPFAFLVLAPATSSSYPTRKDSVSAPVAAPEIDARLEKTRRSSSLGSDASAGGQKSSMRFLKLGPVHSGVHAGEEGDWSEEVIVG